jgi:hypothetical protein
VKDEKQITGNVPKDCSVLGEAEGLVGIEFRGNRSAEGPHNIEHLVQGLSGNNISDFLSDLKQAVRV